jgi:hypothetical protein
MTIHVIDTPGNVDVMLVNDAPGCLKVSFHLFNDHHYSEAPFFIESLMDVCRFYSIWSRFAKSGSFSLTIKQKTARSV